jgi:hypothetical protein
MFGQVTKSYHKYNERPPVDPSITPWCGMRVHPIIRLPIMQILLQFCVLGQIAALAADFSGANLSGAKLTNADLRGSNLSGADLTGANLSGTNLTGTNVSQHQLDSACGSGTQLPADLKIKPCRDSSASRPDTNETGQRASTAQALPNANDDRVDASRILIDVTPMGVQRQDFQQPPVNVLSDSGLEASSQAVRK